jgi:hypothetical protein
MVLDALQLLEMNLGLTESPGERGVSSRLLSPIHLVILLSSSIGHLQSGFFYRVLVLLASPSAPAVCREV